MIDIKSCRACEGQTDEYGYIEADNNGPSVRCPVCYPDKTEQPEPEWESEPDRISYEDEETGYPCLILRTATTGSLCGYVGTKEDHAAYQKDYDSVHEEYNISVHGGLSYSGTHKDESKDIWWIGFDCAHAGDLIPEFNFHGGDIYRNIEYVKSEIASLCTALKTARGEKS